MVIDVRKAIEATHVTGSCDPTDEIGMSNLRRLADWLGWRPYTPGYNRGRLRA